MQLNITGLRHKKGKNLVLRIGEWGEMGRWGDGEMGRWGVF
ncbi:hypothetical protein [Dapis sp. BLCC M172]